MKKSKFLVKLMLLISMASFAQVGIGNTDPKATLDVTGEATTAATADGIIAPRVTGNQLAAKDAAYTADQIGAQVYVTAAATSPSGKTVNVTGPGYYYFDGAAWQNVKTDNLGNHTATMNLNMNNFSITNGDQIQAGSTGRGSAVLRRGGSATEAGFLEIFNPSNRLGFIGSNPTNLLYTAENGANHVFNGGNVGIRTSAPFGRLQVNSSSATNGLVVRFGADWDAMTLAHDGVSAYINASGSEGGIVFRTNELSSGNAVTNAYDEQMRILPNGNVGIGTAIPTQRLDVNGIIRSASAATGGGVELTPGTATQSGYLRIRNGSATSLGYIGFDNTNLTYVAESGANHVFSGGSGSSGNVGIGTNAPNAPLQFSNGVANRKIVLYEQNNNNNQFFGLGLNAGILRYQVDGTSSNHVFFAGANATTSNELMRIQGNGNVGIGTNLPLNLLHLKKKPTQSGGAIKIENSEGTNSWDVNVNTAGHFVLSDIGNIGAPSVHFRYEAPEIVAWKYGGGTAWGAPSDKRIKENIVKFKDGIDVLMKINTVKFNYSNPKFGNKDKEVIGIIAQEMKEVAPYTVSTLKNSKEEYGIEDLLVYDPSSLTYILINSIQEQQEMIKSQQKIAEKQQKMIDLLMMEVKALKNK